MMRWLAFCCTRKMFPLAVVHKEHVLEENRVSATFLVAILVVFNQKRSMHHLWAGSLMLGESFGSQKSENCSRYGEGRGKKSSKSSNMDAQLRSDCRYNVLNSKQIKLVLMLPSDEYSWPSWWQATTYNDDVRAHPRHQRRDMSHASCCSSPIWKKHNDLFWCECRHIHIDLEQ